MNIKSKPLIAALFFLALMSAIIFAVVLPMVYNVGDIVSKIKEQYLKVEESNNRIAMVKQFRSFAKREEDNFSKMDNILVNGDMPDKFMIMLEEAVKESGIEVEFSPAGSQAKDGSWASMGVSMTVSGNIANLMDFVKKLENSYYLIQIKSIDISTTEEDLPDMVKSHILLQAYVK